MELWKRALAFALVLSASTTLAATPVEDDGLAEAAKVIGSRKSRAAARAREMHRSGKQLVAIMPLVGTTRYVGETNDWIAGGVTTGVVVELPVSERFSVEIEGGFESGSIGYQSVRANNTFGAPVLHGFNRGQLGMNLKSYVVRGFVNPYVAAGFHGVRYDGMTRGAEDVAAPFEQWVGAAEVVAGMELAFTPGFSLGARAAFSQPFANLPSVEPRNGGRTIAMGSEESSAMRTGYLRLFGSAKVTF